MATFAGKRDISGQPPKQPSDLHDRLQRLCNSHRHRFGCRRLVQRLSRPGHGHCGRSKRDSGPNLEGVGPTFTYYVGSTATGTGSSTAPSADALLGRGGARVFALLQAQKHILELVHPGVGEQQRWIIDRHQRGTAHDAVPALAKTSERCCGFRCRSAGCPRLVREDEHSNAPFSANGRGSRNAATVAPASPGSGMGRKRGRQDTAATWLVWEFGNVGFRHGAQFAANCIRGISARSMLGRAKRWLAR